MIIGKTSGHVDLKYILAFFSFDLGVDNFSGWFDFTATVFIL